MDVLVLIDKLDDLVHNARTVPLTDQVRIDREEIYDILDQMRATIPEEIKQARWIVKERQEMLAEAKRECDRMLGEAREQAVREASQTEIVKLAERQAQEIIEDARREAREVRLETEDWADSMLSTLEVNFEKFLTAVRRGRERLHERSQETVVPVDDVDDDAGLARASVVAEPGDLLLVHPEVVADLVEDGDPDLLLEQTRIGERLLEREAVDRDLRRQVGILAEQPEQVGVVGMLVLDHDGDVLEPGRRSRVAASRARAARPPRRGRRSRDDEREQRLLRVEAVLGLVPGGGLRAVEHLLRDLLAVVGGQAVEDDGVVGRACDERVVDREAGERLEPARPFLLLAHARPDVRVEDIGAVGGLAWIVGDLRASSGGS